jgi:hypothetical protein
MISVGQSLAGAGAAVGPEAPFHAIRQAVEALDGRDPALVVFFAAASIDPHAASEQAAEAAPGSPRAGMTSAGEITSSGAIHGGCSALAFATPLDVGIGVGQRASADARAAGRAAAAAAFDHLDRRVGYPLLLLFLDAASGDQSHTIRGAYEVTGGRVPLAGGGANSSDGAQFADDRAYRDSVVAVGLVSPVPIGIGVAHGCVPRAVPATVTQSIGRTVREIDGRPAEDVYLEKLGHDGLRLADDAFERFAVLHPLVQLEVTGSVRLRHVHGRADGGGLACATHIPAHAAVGFAEQTPATIVDSAGRAAREAVARLPHPPTAALVFDCAARKSAMGAALDEEVEALIAPLGTATPIAGLYTRGEVGRTNGAKGDLNHAVVVVAFA